MSTSLLTPIRIQFLKNASYSSRLDLHGCPRYFELNKLGPKGLGLSSVTFSFGHAVGAGIQSLLCGQTTSQAIWEMFKMWDVGLLDFHEKQKKSFWEAVWAIEKFEPYARNILNEWEIVYFNGKPAVELSFRLDLQNGWAYRAHIDVILKNKLTGMNMVVELKTTSLSNVPPATYANSDQALSYSLVLDKIAPGETSYEVLYLIYKTKEREYEPMPFTKNVLSKAKWIKGILMDCEQADRYIEEDFFPMRGENCLQYYQPCKFFEMCEMSDSANFVSEDEILERIAKEEATEYTFNFTLQEIIEQQLAHTA